MSVDESDEALRERASAVLKTDHLVLSPPQVAGYLGCSLPTVYKIIYAGELRSFLIGGMRKIAYTDLLDYVDKKTR